jgi:hypothetical protein
MNTQQKPEKPPLEKKPFFTIRKQIYFLIAGFFLLILTPVLIYGLQLHYYYHAPLLDLESAIRLSEWSDQVIAEDVRPYADDSKAKTFYKILENTSETKGINLSGPWCPVDNKTLEAELETWQLMIAFWKEIIEEDRVFYEARAESLRKTIEYASNTTTLPLDTDKLLPKHPNSHVLRMLNNTLRAKYYAELERKDQKAALDTLHLNARLLTPLRVESAYENRIAAFFRHKSIEDYRRLLQFELTHDSALRAWQDTIALRQYRTSIHTMHHLAYRYYTIYYAFDLSKKQGLQDNRTGLKVPAEIIGEIIQEIQYGKESSMGAVLERCTKNPEIFKDTRLRREAREMGTSRASILDNIELETAEKMKAADRYKWLYKAARKDTSFMARHNVPEAIREELDPLTTLIYLEANMDYVSKTGKIEIKNSLVELALAARTAYMESGQWPDGIDAIQAFYQTHGHRFPAAPHGKNIRFHAGWIQLSDNETCQTFWTEELPLDNFPQDIKITEV